MEIRSEMDAARLFESISRLVDENYDLGKPAQVKEITGGFCNKSYAVWASNGDRSRRYFLRLYNPNVVESEILFEHALLTHLRSNGFNLAAAVLPCRNGDTLVRTPPPEYHRGNTALWALFEFLEGEDKYTWTYTDLTDKEFGSAAEVLARLHHCGHGFQKPPNADRAQPRIMEFVPTFKKTFTKFLERNQGRRCDRLFKANFNSICKAIDAAAAIGPGLQGMKKIPIHCDYHPGNLKYRDEQCVGIFDFDWAKIDYRLFDVALGIVYFTSIWNEQVTGLRMDKFSLFLNVYNETCQRLSHIDPLTPQELTYLVPMLSAANLYVLNWDLTDFYGIEDPDDDEYYSFIHHNIGLISWIEDHAAELGSTLPRR